GDGGHGRRSDLGFVQCRLCNDLQFRAHDAGRTRLVDRTSRIGDQHRAVGFPVSVPFGGFVADRMKRPQTVLVVGCMIFAGLMLVFSHSGAVIASVIALGLISGQPAGPMMSLPAGVLQPMTRAIGMGLIYTVYYAAM